MIFYDDITGFSSYFVAKMDLAMYFDEFLENDGENRQKLGSILLDMGSQPIHCTLYSTKNLCDHQKNHDLNEQFIVYFIVIFDYAVINLSFRLILVRTEPNFY